MPEGALQHDLESLGLWDFPSLSHWLLNLVSHIDEIGFKQLREIWKAKVIGKRVHYNFGAVLHMKKEIHNSI